MAKKTKQIAEVDMDSAYYLGTGNDGVYFDAAKFEGLKGRGGWYVSTVVDTAGGAYCGDMTTDDGPYESQGRALEAGLDEAYEWLTANEIWRGWRTDGNSGRWPRELDNVITYVL